MARPLWSGSITFGLVSIPIRLVTAVRDKDIHFHLLSEDGKCRLRRKLFCPETHKEYDLGHTARGYEIAPDQYVIIQDKELTRLKPEAGRTIEIVEFVDLASIDPIYFNQVYYLVPGEGGAKAYQLLMSAMEKTQRVGIARFVMHQRQHLAAIRKTGEGLAIHTMHYGDEVMAWKDLGEHRPAKAEVDKKQFAVACQLIDALAATFDPNRYRDDYRHDLKELIDAKAHGQLQTVSSEAPHEAPPPTYDIMAALKKSIAEQKKPQPTPKPRSSNAGRKKSA